MKPNNSIRNPPGQWGDERRHAARTNAALPALVFLSFPLVVHRRVGQEEVHGGGRRARRS